MSEKCLIFTTEHQEHVAEVRLKISANSWESKPKTEAGMLGRHSWLVGAGSFVSQHVPWEAFGECALERVRALPAGSCKGYPWGHCFPQD